MTGSHTFLLSLVLLTGCAGVVSEQGDAGLEPGDAAVSTGGGSAANTGGGGAATGGGTSVDAGQWEAGSPSRHCSAALPSRAQPVDVSTPTTVVGTGTAASCTFSALNAAVSAGGIITFNCGPQPVTITVTSPLKLSTTKDTVIDGGRLVTLDGAGAVQLLRFEGPSFRTSERWVTLQHLRLRNGRIDGSSPIPAAPAPCSQGFNAGEGGALYVSDGNASIIDCIFENNQAASVGPDVAGGAVRMVASKHGVFIASSTFRNNSASNGGGVGCLFAELNVFDSLFENNRATGHDANNVDSVHCTAMNNGQFEIGSGGNGGALYNDGASVNVSLCGATISANAAGSKAFGGGLFFTSNDFGGTLTIADTTMNENTGGSWTVVKSGSTTNAGTAVGTNAKSLTITNSTLQGLP